MLVARNRQDDLPNPSLYSICTSTTQSSSCFSAPRPILKFARRVFLPFVPASFSTNKHFLSSINSKDFCLPRQEPRPSSFHLLVSSSLSSCSPSLVKFSRNLTEQFAKQQIANRNNFLHPNGEFRPTNGLRIRSHHHRRTRR